VSFKLQSTVDTKEHEILEFLKNRPSASSKEVFEGLPSSSSYATVKRILAKLKEDGLVATLGTRKATKYAISPAYAVLEPVNLETYYQRDIDERIIKRQFDFQLLREVLPAISILSVSETAHLQALQDTFLANVASLSESEYMKEMERLAIDLSWKSSQIEGNTYSLLETERLIREKLTATGKTKDEATMLLNHKEALDFILENPDYLNPLRVSAIEDIHRLLTKELGVDKNVRRRRVGITGTNYQPLDNEFQIMEALQDTCSLINAKTSVFEKALLALVLLSYIQPFMDGNKRTARIVSNAILIQYHHCPISFRTIDSVEYKKAMLLFYEQNNISSFKQIFIEQFEFAVNTYF
jgi:Fic family protein